jgi:hypothetical protein
MGRVVANGCGIAHVHSAVEIHVVLEIRVVQGYPRIVADK